MTSEIKILLELGEDKMPVDIHWLAPDGGVEDPQRAKALLLGLWDGAAKAALRIDLWTTKMGIDEMNDFYYQTFIGMADTYTRATGNTAISENMRKFAHDFIKQASEQLNGPRHEH